MTTRVSPAGPDPAPRPSASNTRSARSSPAPRPSTMSRTAIVWKIATRAAASFRARKTRNDRRVASAGSTSPRTTPPSRYASGAPTIPATSADETSEMSVSGPSTPSKTAFTRLWAMPTGMPTMTPATRTRQKTARDRCSAARTVIGLAGLPTAEDRRRHRLALDPGDEDADPGQGDEQPVPEAGPGREQALHVVPRRVDRRRPRARTSPARAARSCPGRPPRCRTTHAACRPRCGSAGRSWRRSAGGSTRRRAARGR